MDLRACLGGFAVACLAVLATGCFLRLTIGRVEVYDDTGEFVHSVFAAIDSEATTAVCQEDFYTPPGPLAKHASRCTYFVEGSQITSTFELDSQLGVFAVVVDPLLVQVPATATAIRATFTRDGVNGNLAITEFPGAVPVDSTRRIVPEPGRRLIALDFPNDPPTVGGSPYQFHLEFNATVPRNAPFTVKALFAARVTDRGQTFYAPVMPCVTDLSL